MSRLCVADVHKIFQENYDNDITFVIAHYKKPNTKNFKRLNYDSISKCYVLTNKKNDVENKQETKSMISAINIYNSIAL